MAEKDSPVDDVSLDLEHANAIVKLGSDIKGLVGGGIIGFHKGGIVGANLSYIAISPGA